MVNGTARTVAPISNMILSKLKSCRHIREGRVSDAVALLNESNNIDVNSEQGVIEIFEAMQ